VTRLARLITMTLLGGATSACTLLHARSLGPPLEVPPPPARVVPIASQNIVEPTSKVDDVPSREPEPIADAPASPPPARPERGESAQPARTEAPVDAGAAAAPPPAPAPANTLQTTNPTEAEQRTRTALERAKTDLGKIDLRRLSTDARSQYDIAKRFVQQAEDALRARNPVFAEQLADKAATLAALLQKQ
jgi:hypothetical protein